MGKIRGIHSSPGIYTKFTDLSYAAKTLGVTTLGLVGETLKGPAFELVPISSWTEYVQYFGGTSPVKFKGSKYPKYELPYIAKEYLSVSDQLYVCRVLGLSGYNAGPAFAICAYKSSGSGGSNAAVGSNGSSKNENNRRVICVLRSRATYKKYPANSNDCQMLDEYDTLKFLCNKITIKEYNSTDFNDSCDVTGRMVAGNLSIDSFNRGRFTIECDNGEEYPVSLNVEDKDYIYNVLGSDPLVDGPEVYVEELYDVMLDDGISKGELDKISTVVNTYKELKIMPVTDPVSDFVTIDKDDLANNYGRKLLGRTFLYNSAIFDDTVDPSGFQYVSGCKGQMYDGEEDESLKYAQMNDGEIYYVASIIDPQTSQKKYVYVSMTQDVPCEKGDECYEENENKTKCVNLSVGAITSPSGKTYNEVKAVKVLSKNKYYCLGGASGSSVIEASDFSDYKEGFRPAQTPWIVSEIKGNGTNLDVLKLFKFYTISDGNSSNSEIKISIANVSPDDGTFDVYIRDFNDVDGSIIVLESYKNLTMRKSDKNYIGLKIGTLNGEYEARSKYVLVDIIENDMTAECVPCGFLGYPTRNYKQTDDDTTEQPTFEYNISYDETKSERKQYFGLSNITGIDVDMLTYKGLYAYTEDYGVGHTDAFHLDCRLNKDILKDQLENASGYTKVTIDGVENTVKWQGVSPNSTNSTGAYPVISTEYDMEGSIYESKTMRKFTVCLYGGFDGWDIYRSSRTNTDKYRANKYRGRITNGHGATFSEIDNPESLALSGRCINSDYYAYLAGAMQFENPEKAIINLFATPGIDYVNNALLTNDILEMIEDVRGDALYVMTTPDKPAGVGDAVDEMFTPREATDNLEDSNIDTYYAATYYPWVKCYDSDNLIYINLPVTKDVLRNMADVDNKKYPWYAPAGIERGNVNCVKARIFSKLEDEDTLYDGRINPVKTFSRDGVKIWGNKTLYTGDTPMNRVNVVRLMLYMRKLIVESCRALIFEPNDATLKGEFEGIVKPILEQIQKDRGITAFRLDVSQTPEQIDAHELSCVLWVKPTPALEYIEINFMVTPQGVDFDTV